MPQADRNSQKENKSRGNEPNFNWRGVILIVIAFSFIALAMLFYRGGMQPVEDVPYNRFLELLDNKQIVTDKNYPLQLVVEDGRPTQTLRGAYVRQGVGSAPAQQVPFRDRKSTRLNSSHTVISYAVFCLKKKTLKVMA